MEYTYRNRKHIARIALISTVIILLLALNYRLWGGFYTEGDLEDIILTQSDELKHCILCNNEVMAELRDASIINHVSDVDFIGILTFCSLFSVTWIVWDCRNKSDWKDSFTLVSLCVRMDE
jgi:hypothetical protein